jgi:glycosyltransferase involved in cell wall biosynthesis
MRIVHFTSAHPWDATRIFSKMCVHLSKLGHDVVLVAVDPEAEETCVFDKDGVEVHLRPGSGKTSRLQRATNIAWDVTRYAASLKPEILHFHDPELIPHTLIALNPRVPLVFDAHEDFASQMDRKAWVGTRIRSVLKVGLCIMRWLIDRRATHILAATQGVRDSYSQQKSTVIRNLPILAEINSGRRIPLSNRPKESCYIGAISKIRGIVELVDALEKSKEIERFHLAGNFSSDTLQREVEAMPGWKKVDYHGYINRNQIVEILGRVRVGMVTLHATPNHLHSIPIKMLEYLCAGVPSICSNFSYWTEFIEEGKTGRFIDPMDTDAIATALDEALSDKGAAFFESQMIEKVRTRFSWEEEVEALEDVYLTCSKK